MNIESGKPMYVLYAIGLTLITLALQGIETSIVYCVWCGTSIVLTCVISHLYFCEKLNPQAYLSIIIIILGVIILKY
ncbi:MAG TPA: SMR family transporter [Gammaproteobacteria bacterium]|nr:SMR family transporter [Gammaproteobacteria bacterium]